MSSVDPFHYLIQGFALVINRLSHNIIQSAFEVTIVQNVYQVRLSLHMLQMLVALLLCLVKHS